MRQAVLLSVSVLFFFTAIEGWALEHVVQEGETFSSILARYAPDKEVVMRVNNLSPGNLNSLPVGRHLIIPHPFDGEIARLQQLAGNRQSRVTTLEADLEKKRDEIGERSRSLEEARREVARLERQEATLIFFQWLAAGSVLAALLFLWGWIRMYRKVGSFRSERDLARKERQGALEGKENWRTKYIRRIRDLQEIMVYSEERIKLADALLDKSEEQTGSSHRALRLVKGSKEG